MSFEIENITQLNDKSITLTLLTQYQNNYAFPCLLGRIVLPTEVLNMLLGPRRVEILLHRHVENTQILMVWAHNPHVGDARATSVDILHTQEFVNESCGNVGSEDYEGLDRRLHHRLLEDFIPYRIWDCINAKDMMTVVYNAFLGKLLLVHSFLL